MIRLFHAYFPVRTLLLGVSEVFLVASAFILATVMHFGGNTELILSYEYGFIRIFLVTGVLMLCMYYFDLYDAFVLGNPRESLSRLVQVLGAGMLVLAVVYYAYPETRLGRGVFFLGIAFFLLFLPPWRGLFLRMVQSRQLAQRVVIVGSSPLAADLSTEMQKRPELGMEIVGYVDVSLDGPPMGALHYLGGPEALDELALRGELDRVIVTMDDRRGKLPLEKLLALKIDHAVSVQDGTEVYERITGKVPVESLRLSWFIFSHGFRFSPLQLFCRRLVSLFGAVVGLVVSLPLMGLIAMAIKLDSRGPAIFRQHRVGKREKVFTLYKFRTMHHGADRAGKPRPALENDPRFTRVGRWLRRSRLDELPQLYNILKGEMDIVGPRPFPPSLEKELARQVPFYRQRWSVKPGATGWAQVQRGYCATVEDNAEKLSYDLFYIKNMSLGLDLLILFQTVKILLWGRGAR